MLCYNLYMVFCIFFAIWTVCNLTASVIVSIFFSTFSFTVFLIMF